jgi:hypothetical protein
VHANLNRKLSAGLGVTVLVAVAAAVADSHTGASASAVCTPTHPNRYHPRWAERATSTTYFHGGPGLFIDLGPRMTILPVRDTSAPIPSWAYVGEPRADGSVRAKVIFQRDLDTPGRLRITGVRTHIGRGVARTSRGARGDLVFRHPGCWKVNARWGAAHLNFVVRVLDP